MPGTFPLLRTGAVVQYPFERHTRYRTETVRFLNHAEQVYQDVNTARRTWVIRLAELDGREVASLRQLFEDNQGRKGTFSFTDPWDSVNYPNVAFASDEFPVEQEIETQHSLTLTIYERP